jgi:hypothetical protein
MRCLPLPGVMLLGLLLSVPAIEAGAQAEADKPPEAAEKKKLSPEMEEKLAEFLKKAAESKVQHWTLRMKQEIDTIGKITALSEEEKKSLEAPARNAAELCIGPWLTKVEESVRPNFDGKQVNANFIDQIVAQAPLYGRQEFPEDYTRPSEHPSWLAALERTLGPERYTLVRKVQGGAERCARKADRGVPRSGRTDGWSGRYKNRADEGRQSEASARLAAGSCGENRSTS